jgi:hypothetical protein
MYRPERQRNNLVQKVAEKESRSHKKPGRRTKRWRKWLERYKGIAAGQIGAPAEAGTASAS